MCANVWCNTPQQGKASSTHKFDGNLLIVQQIGTLEDDTEGTLSYLLAYSIMNTNNVG